DLNADRYVLTERSRSPGWTRATQSCSVCSRNDKPVKSSHGLLKNVQHASAPAVHSMIGASSTIVRKHCSLSVSFASVFFFWWDASTDGTIRSRPQNRTASSIENGAVMFSWKITAMRYTRRNASSNRRILTGDGQAMQFPLRVRISSTLPVHR